MILHDRVSKPILYLYSRKTVFDTSFYNSKVAFMIIYSQNPFIIKVGRNNKKVGADHTRIRMNFKKRWKIELFDILGGFYMLTFVGSSHNQRRL